jgi:hypothetical protein
MNGRMGPANASGATSPEVRPKEKLEALRFARIISLNNIPTVGTNLEEPP